MGSAPWRNQQMWRVLESAKYRAGGSFVIERGSRRAEGAIEFGNRGRSRQMVVFVGDPQAAKEDAVIPFDAHTKIDGVPAKDWRP